MHIYIYIYIYSIMHIKTFLFFCCSSCWCSRSRTALSKQLLKQFLRENTTREGYAGAPWLLKVNLLQCVFYSIRKLFNSKQAFFNRRLHFRCVILSVDVVYSRLAWNHGWVPDQHGHARYVPCRQRRVFNLNPNLYMLSVCILYS